LFLICCRLTESFSLGATPTTREAQAIADEIFADFVSGEADKVELVYTKFVSLISSNPTIQTLLPLTPTGELCDVDGNCVDAAEDEIFKLTTQVRGGACSARCNISCKQTVAGQVLREGRWFGLVANLLVLLGRYGTWRRRGSDDGCTPAAAKLTSQLPNTVCHAPLRTCHAAPDAPRVA
jgi:hypothetical protein